MWIRAPLHFFAWSESYHLNKDVCHIRLQGDQMKCPHCTLHIHEDWNEGWLVYRNQSFGWKYRVAQCPSCAERIIQCGHITDRLEQFDWKFVHPIGAARGPVHPAVPVDIGSDYIEACNVLPISPKAAAALARRCLQAMLHAAGYRARDLAKEMDLLLSEPDSAKALPVRLRETVDGIRNFGNFSAHPIDDKTSLQIIDVEPHEAEWCLEIIEELFEHFYVGPSIAKAKKDGLNAKLAAAGKPPAK
jgi:hypothetical protein